MTKEGAESSLARPLDGVRVLDLCIGPMGAISRYLSDLGADVVRLEPEAGGEDRRCGAMLGNSSVDFIAANLGKRCASIDRLDDLSAGADIVVAPLGLIDVDALRSHNPRLVVMTVSDFGDTAGFRDWSATDAVFHALSGELSRSGIPGREPLLPPGNLAIECAAVQATWSLLLAFWQSLKTGQGDTLDFSILDGAVQALDPGFGIGGSATAGVPASQLPRGRPEARFMYPIFPCKDGHVRICVLAPRQWRGMFKWMGEPSKYADPSFESLTTRFKSKTLIPDIERFFSDKTREAIEAEAQTFGVPAAALLDLDEALTTPQMTARGPFRNVEIEAGVEAPFPDGVMEIDGERMGFTGPAPILPIVDAEWLERETIPHPAAKGTRPLEGLRVLDLGVIVVGAEAGRLLADQGADVIKVESSSFPDGSRQNRGPEPISSSFAAGHRNKRSLGIDLRSEAGKAKLVEVIRHSDVLLSNFKGGTLESLGLDYRALKQINPRIIVTDSSAFGPTGPWSRRMGYGPLVRASAGLTKEWRYPGELDSFSDAITIYPDHVVGRIVAIGVLALLVRRLRSNVGGSVSVSQAEVMLSHLGSEIARRALQSAAMLIVKEESTSAVFRCLGEDNWCAVTLRNSADRTAMQRIVGGKSFDEWFEEIEPLDAMHRLQEAGIPAGAMLRVSELPGFEYFRSRGFFRITEHPCLPAPVPMENAPVRSGNLPDPPDAPAPLLGEHSREVIEEILGLEGAELQQLFDDGTLEEQISAAAR